MDKATQKSIEWQKANNPMAIGGDSFADMVDSFNVNPAFVAGYKEAENDLALTTNDIKRIVDIYDECLSLTFEDGKPAYESEGFHMEVLRRFLEQRKK